MAANMPQMAGGGQMRGRPAQQQLTTAVYTHIVNQPVPQGWQTTLSPQNRLANAMNIISNSFLAHPQLDAQSLMGMGMSFEKEAFQQSPDKGTYDTKIGARVGDLFRKRQANEAQVQNTLNQQAAAAQAQAQAHAQAQQIFMNPNAMHQMQRGMGQPQQGGFQHLQQPMQASPIPQQPQQQGMTMQNMSANSMNPGMQGMQPGANPMMPQGPQMNAANITPQARAKAQQIALARIQSQTEEQRNNMRAQLRQRIGPQTFDRLQQEGQDPLLIFLQQQVLSSAAGRQPNMGPHGPMNPAMLQAQQRQQQQQHQQHQQQHQQQQHQQQQQQHQHQQQQHQHQHQQQQQQQQQLQHQQQRMNPNGQPGGDIGGPFSNVEIMNQQKAGMMAQEAGQMVVPASQGRNATPQPLGAVDSNQQGPNQQGRPPHMGQQFNMQQAQQHKMDQVAAQSQAQIRAQAQAKQQMQGQPGGLGGGGAVSQSPSMGTLNAPVSRPPVAMGPGAQQPTMSQGNAPFGPGFNPGNPRQAMNPVQRNPIVAQMLNQMPPEQRQAFLNLPTEKMNEIMAKWSASRAASMAGRPQPSTQQGHFGQGNPMAQFTPGGNGQQPNPSMAVNGQNSMMVQQQVGRVAGMRPPGSQPIMPSNPRAAAMANSMDIPPKVLSQLSSVPQDIKKWGQLRQWLAAQSLPPQFTQSLLQIQAAQFNNFLASRPPQHGHPTQPPQGIPGQVPQPGPNPHQFTVTVQEIENAKNHEKFMNLPDEQVRAALLQMKIIRAKSAPGMAGPVAQPAQQLPQPAPPVSATPPTQAGPAVPPRPAPSNNKPQQPPQAANSRPTATPTPQPNPSPAVPQANNLKRPSSDDLADTTSHNTPMQRQPSQQHPPAPSAVPTFTPAQLANMSPEQRAKAEQLMKGRQSVAMQNTQEDYVTLKRLGHEEQLKCSSEHWPPVPMSAEEHAEVAQKIQRVMAELNKSGRYITRWYQLKHDDTRARMFFRMRARLALQFDSQTNLPKDVFSIRSNDVDQVMALMESIYRDMGTLQSRKPGAQPNEAAPQTGATGQGATPTSQPAALNAANLEKNTQAIGQPQRKNSSAVPAAPTTTQPPFPIGAASPHGQPSYANKPAFTANDLVMPARKKARTGQSGSTSVSPQVSKQPSPQMQKRAQAPPSAPPKPQFQCPVQGCEANSIGFVTEEAKRAHYEEEHAKPYEDPLKFATDHLAEVLGLDATGQAKPSADGPSNGTPVPVATGPTFGQSPAGGAQMARNSSMKRSDSASGATGKTTDTKGQDKMPTPTQAQPALPDATCTFGTIDPQDLFQNMGMEFGGGGAISDMAVYRAITPNDTPESSKESTLSEPNSDVSEGVALNLNLDLGFDTWQPFEGDQLLNMGAADMDSNFADAGGLLAMDTSGAAEFASWDEVPNDFSKGFALDSSLYMLDTN